jgi:hypothetical protein
MAGTAEGFHESLTEARSWAVLPIKFDEFLGSSMSFQLLLESRKPPLLVTLLTRQLVRIQ